MYYSYVMYDIIFYLKYLTIYDMKSHCIRFGIGRSTGEFSGMMHVSTFNDQSTDQLTTSTFGDSYAATWTSLTQPIQSLSIQVPKYSSGISATSRAQVYNASQFDFASLFNMNFFVRRTVYSSLCFCKIEKKTLKHVLSILV